MKRPCVKTYLRAVQKSLDGSEAERTAFIKGVRSELDGYKLSHPDADYEELCEVFGSPENCVKVLIPSREVRQLKKTAKRRLVALTVSIVLAIVFALTAMVLLKAYESSKGHMEIVTYTVFTHENEINNDSEWRAMK